MYIPSEFIHPYLYCQTFFASFFYVTEAKLLNSLMRLDFPPILYNIIIALKYFSKNRTTGLKDMNVLTGLKVYLNVYAHLQ